MSEEAKPNQTKPNQTKPNQTKPNQTKALLPCEEMLEKGRKAVRSSQLRIKEAKFMNQAGKRIIEESRKKRT
jgi:hypothetical protein